MAKSVTKAEPAYPDDGEKPFRLILILTGLSTVAVTIGVVLARAMLG